MPKLNKIQEKFIRTSKHTTKFANSSKLFRLEEFINEYRRTASIFIDYLWNNELVWIDTNKINHTLDIKNMKYDIPSHMDYNLVQHDSWLSARAICSLSNQVLSMVKSTIEAQDHRWHMIYKLSDNKEEIPFNLLLNIIKGEPRKPKSDRINPELSSKNIDIEETNKHFDIFIRIKCLGKCLGKLKEIKIPVKFHRQSMKWKNQSKMMGSILVKKDSIELRWEFERKKKTDGITVGADQGKNTVLTLSDGQTTPEKDIHGHSLDSIMKKMSKKKKGSKNFKKTQKHRENFTNWSLNQLDLSKINQVNYEEVLNLRFGKSTSRFMSHWTYTCIDKKFNSRCDESGVQMNHQSSACESQRCSECGFVHYLNRKGKKFGCRRCGSAKNADLNASTNHEIELPSVVEFIMSTRMNRTSGFYWKPEGIFGIDGKELGVPNAKKAL